MKRKKPIRSRNSVKRRKSRAIRPNLRNGTSCCGLLSSITKVFSPLVKALGIR